MTDPIITEARKLFVADKLRGKIVEDAALRGDYDAYGYLAPYIKQAEVKVLKDRKEAEGE